jgi:glutamate-ammonia-ligase adenylyltransferase
MALTRARIVAGPIEPAAGIIAAVLQQARDLPGLRKAVLAMRADMAAAKPPQGRLDVKLASGGLVDLEFIVHFRQLASGRGLSPELPAALEDLVSAGLLPATLMPAHDMLARTLIWLRLLFAGARVPDVLPDPVAAILARALGAANFADFTSQLAIAREAVRMAWTDVFAKDV